MKARLFTVFVLAVSLVLALMWAVAAQGSEPPVALQRDGPPPRAPAWAWDGEKP
jgi:hypothetical protein